MRSREAVEVVWSRLLARRMIPRANLHNVVEGVVGWRVVRNFRAEVSIGSASVGGTSRMRYVPTSGMCSHDSEEST